MTLTEKQVYNMYDEGQTRSQEISSNDLHPNVRVSHFPIHINNTTMEDVQTCRV